MSPSFCKQYAQIGLSIQQALNTYKSEVEQRQFPNDQYAPYKLLNDNEVKALREWKQQLQDWEGSNTGTGAAAESTTAPATPLSAQPAAQDAHKDAGDTIKVY